MDGAPYHRSDEMLDYFRKQNAPVIISGPYSYDSAVAELWFAYFKNKNLNPEQLPMGKR